jgi:hypothetical protein
MTGGQSAEETLMYGVKAVRSIVILGRVTIEECNDYPSIAP